MGADQSQAQTEDRTDTAEEETLLYGTEHKAKDEHRWWEDALKHINLVGQCR